MTRGDQYPEAAETQGAVMLQTVEHPLEFSIPLMAQELALDNVTVFRSVERLDDRHWLVGPLARGPQSRMPERKLEPSGVFWRCYERAMDRVEGLPSGDRALFRSAVVQGAKLRVLTPNDERQRDVCHANFLGRAMLLGKRHEVISPDWLRGLPGWQLLAGTAATQDDLFS